MICSLSDLRDKEVIDIKSGEKLGFVDDIEIETKSGSVLAFVIFGKERFFGLLGRDEDIIISCREIELIGSDTILVSIKNDTESTISAKSPKSKSFKLQNLCNDTK